MARSTALLTAYVFNIFEISLRVFNKLCTVSTVLRSVNHNHHRASFEHIWASFEPSDCRNADFSEYSCTKPCPWAKELQCPTNRDSNVIIRYDTFSLLSAFTSNVTRAQACLSPSCDCSQALFQHSLHPLMSSGSDSTEAGSSAYDLWPRS